MQSVSSRVWTRVTVSISYDDNHYTTGTFFLFNWYMRLKLTHAKILPNFWLTRVEIWTNEMHVIYILWSNNTYKDILYFDYDLSIPSLLLLFLYTCCVIWIFIIITNEAYLSLLLIFINIVYQGKKDC